MYTYRTLFIVIGASLLLVVTISSVYLTKMLVLLSCDGLRWNGRSVFRWFSIPIPKHN
ncbi:hypothetical protein Hanom_Chr04g00294771 [Helianthus anomalus]